MKDGLSELMVDLDEAIEYCGHQYPGMVLVEAKRKLQEVKQQQEAFKSLEDAATKVSRLGATTSMGQSRCGPTIR